MTFTVTELRSISAYCRIAAEIYDNDAKEAQSTSQRLVDQFQRQAKEARRIAEEIDSTVG